MRRRWSRSSKLFAALAVVFALAAFAIVNGYASKVRALAPVLGSAVPVLVASQDLARGTELSGEMLREVRFPSGLAPPGAIGEPRRAAGRILLAGMAEGEPLTESRLAPKGSGPVASLVPAGFQAFAIASSLPPGAVIPGDRVDVLATFGGGHPHTETSAQGVEVLLILRPGQGAGPAGTEGGPQGQALMLLVTQEDADHLAYAQAFANLSVVVDPAGEGNVEP